MYVLLHFATREYLPYKLQYFYCEAQDTTRAYALLHSHLTETPQLYCVPLYGP